MKKVMKFFGIEVYASNKSIKGRKSNGAEDTSTFKNWRLRAGEATGESLN